VPRAQFLILLAILGCRSTHDPYGGDAAERLLDVEAKGEGLAPYGQGFAIHMADSWRTDRTIPEGIRKRLEAGNTWLLLEEPIVFAAAARWIARGATPFVPDEIVLKAAHDRLDDELGREPPLRPSLLILRGSVSLEAKPEEYRIERLDGLSIEKLGLGHGIKALESEADRVALGRGVETAMQLATGRIDDGVGQSSYDWITTFKEGAAVPDAEWIAALDKPVDERRPYHAIIRRYRPSVEPRESWFSVPLNVVMLCSQMNLKTGLSGRVDWEWEGFWLGRLGKPASTPPATKTPPVRVVYAEYKTRKGQRQGGAFLSSVFDPVTRTGQSALEELKKRGADAFVPRTD